MNKRISEIAHETLKKVPVDRDNFEKWIDAYLLEYSRTIIFECSDVVRESAKKYGDETQVILKSTAVDVLDHFGL
jgi:hypothetical protein